MSDYIYPRKTVAVTPPDPLLTTQQMRDRMIQLLEGGKTKKVALNTVISEATGANVTWNPIIKMIFQQIQDEKEALQALSPLGFATVQEFKAAMDAICTLIPTQTWITKLQEKYDITGGTAAEQFEELKTKVLAEQQVTP